MKNKSLLVVLLAVFLVWGGTLAAAAETRFLDYGNGIILDTKTHLIWKKSDRGDKRSWREAREYCEDLFFQGFVDWRLPQIDELIALADYTSHKPALDPIFDSRSNRYWSSSIHAGDADRAWAINFLNGEVEFQEQKQEFYAKCVRRGPFSPADPAQYLKRNSAHTVRDNLHRLTWQQADDGIPRTFEEAVSYCDDLVLDGYKGWRIPTVAEMLSLVDYTAYDPAIFTDLLEAQSFQYWTGSPLANSPGRSWAVDFSAGSTADWFPASTRLLVRCVRGGSDSLATLALTRRPWKAGSVMSTPEGIDCGDQCKHTFRLGTRVSLAAMAEEGYEFAGWEGACRGTGDCTLILDRYFTSVGARFRESDLPVVTVSAIRERVPENGREAGVFKVTRTGPASKELAVRYGIVGTATNGVDYRALPGEVVIPARISSTTIQVVPRKDSLNEGDETVGIRLLRSRAYTRGVPEKAEIVIADAVSPPAGGR